MADSARVRQQRHRAHQAGDHRLCRGNCPVVRLEVAEPDGPVEPQVELNASAARLAALCRQDPANVAAAHELRLTLEALSRTPPPDDPLDELLRLTREIP